MQNLVMKQVFLLVSICIIIKFSYTHNKYIYKKQTCLKPVFVVFLFFMKVFLIVFFLNHVNAFIKKVKYLEFFFIKSSRRLKKTNTFLLSINILFLFKYNSFTGKKF